MVKERPVRVIVLLLSLVTLTSCATVSLQLYEGPQRPDSDVSIVRLWGPGGIVQKIDGKDAGVRGTESHAYLLPGDHTFELKLMRIQAYHVLCGALCDAIFNKPRTVTARTEAGHAYTFNTLNDEAVTLVIEDKGTSYDPLCLDPRRYREGKDC